MLNHLENNLVPSYWTYVICASTHHPTIFNCISKYVALSLGYHISMASYNQKHQKNFVLHFPYNGISL